jgi:hypothetical protein
VWEQYVRPLQTVFFVFLRNRKVSSGSQTPVWLARVREPGPHQIPDVAVAEDVGVLSDFSVGREPLEDVVGYLVSRWGRCGAGSCGAASLGIERHSWAMASWISSVVCFCAVRKKP